MKKIKKLLALGLALIMCLGMATTAFAAGEVQKVQYQTDESIMGTITIKNATIGKEYKVYQLFDATVAGDKVAYTTTKEVAEKFNVIDGNVFEFKPNTAGSYNVSIKTDPETNETYSNEKVIAFLQNFVEEKTEGENSTVEVAGTLPYLTMSSTTATNETIQFTNVPLGYYLVASSLGATITLDAADASATIIDKNQSGPSWDGDGKVIVNEDAETDAEKEVKVDSANYGDTIKFKVSVYTTNYEGADPIIEYTVKDVLDGGMSYVTKDGSPDVTVRVQGQDEPLSADQYSIAYGKKTVDEVEVDDPNSFIITIKWNNYTESEGKVIAGDMLYDSPSKITVEYSATVEDSAVIAGEGNKNTANFGYTTVKEDGTTEDKGHEESNKKETKTYVYALGIVKTNLQSEMLDDATFILELDGKGLIVEEINADGTEVVGDTHTGIYKFVGYANAESTDPEGNTVPAQDPTPVTTIGGKILVKGVEDGTYTLTETKAPAGYNALVESVTVDAVLEVQYSDTVTETIYYDKDNKVTNVVTDATNTVTVNETFDSPVAWKTVVNFTGTLLPSTGGIGTTIFYVVGGLLVAGAGILLITKKRMSKEQ